MTRRGGAHAAARSRIVLMTAPVTAAFGLAGCLLASDDCNREGCDAMEAPAGHTGEASIAGAVAYQPDVVANGCQECGFTTARLDVWQTPTLVTSDAEARAAVFASPVFQIDADGRYRTAAGPGFYLLCIEGMCVSLEVSAASTTTVNIKRLFGPARFYVSAPGGKSLQEVGGYSAHGY